MKKFSDKNFSYWSTCIYRFSFNQNVIRKWLQNLRTTSYTRTLRELYDGVEFIKGNLQMIEPF